MFPAHDQARSRSAGVNASSRPPTAPAASRAALEAVLDHVIVNVVDGLDAAVEAYLRLGFTLTPRGRHSLGSCNHLAMFGDTYLELFGYEPGEGVSVPDVCTDPVGLTGLAFKGSDAAAIHGVMVSAGLDAAEPLHFSRPVDTDDGPKPARFSIVSVPPGHIRNGRAFFCCHHTPELVWMPGWQGHANGARDITGFFIASADPERTIAPYRAIFGPELAETTPEGLRFQAGAATVHVMRHEAALARFGDAIVPLVQDDDRMVALRIETGELGSAAAALRKGGVAARPTPEGLLVASADANGVAIEFTGVAR